MVREIRFHFEGDPSLREGFNEFLREIKAEARLKKCRFACVAAKGRPFEVFRNALNSHPGAWNVLLLDSDGPYNSRLCQQRCQQHGIDHTSCDSVFWMVQVMEAWFLADVEGLKSFYKQGFNAKKLNGHSDVDRILKKDVYEKLKEATKGSRKGAYHKTQHAPALLRHITPENVRRRSRHCREMFQTIRAKL